MGKVKQREVMTLSGWALSGRASCELSMSRARGTEPGVDLSSRLDRDRTPYIAVLIIIVNELRSGIIIIVKELSVLLHPKLLVILIFRFIDFVMHLDIIHM